MVRKRHKADLLQLLMAGGFVFMLFFIIGNNTFYKGSIETEYVIKGHQQNEITPLTSSVRVSISKLNQTSFKKTPLINKVVEPNLQLADFANRIHNRFAMDFQFQLFLSKIIFPFHYYW